MRRSRLSEQELRLEAERFVQYKGTARVRLEVLHFQWNEPRELSRKNVERLKGIFGGDKRSYENMRRLDARNHIPAVVEQFDLDDAILASELSAERLLSNPDNDPPMLKLAAGYRLTCLHGRHRIQAAREILPPTDAWWTVDLYLADANPELRTTLVEEYSNEEKPSDGEIYRKIRQYEREGSVCFKKRWKAHLSDHGRRGLRQLCNHGDGEFVAAFDKLLDISGLWDGMRISTLHKMLDMKCDEEALHYLELIRKTFDKIFKRVLRRDKTALQRVDQVTIKAFELKAPKCSKRDAQVLQGQLLSGQICSLFSQEEREAIWSELRSIDYLIPSLFTFFEDLKYLRACADCLKRLVQLSRRDTVRTALERKFPHTDEASDPCVVEVTESIFVDSSARAVDRFDLGYRQLWAFAMREYREMPTEAKKKSKDLLAKAGVQRADEEVLSRAANLANRVGFVSDETQALRQRSSDREIARNALLKARKPSRYQYDQTVLEANVAQIVRLFMTATPLPSEYTSPALVCDNPDAAGNRCGFPDEDAQQQDSKHLFIPYLHHESEEQGEEITSFFVRRSIYLAFFGKSTNLGMDNGPDLFPPPPRQPQRQRIEREELERAEAEQRERQGQERQEQERREQERLEQERLEQEGLERERREQEEQARERLEQQRMEQEQEQERLEQERLAQERLERERLEHERLELEQEQERLEQERLEQERQRLEQERFEQERLELGRIEEILEREDLQERLGQALQAQEKLEQEKRNQQAQEKQEKEKQEEETRRQETREQDRRDQEKSLEDLERTRKRHTQIDMESIVSSTTRNQMGLSSANQAQEQQGEGRELVVVNPGSAHHPQTQVHDSTIEQQERLEQERLEREKLQQRFAQRLREQEELEQKEQEAMRRRENQQEQKKQRKERRDQVRQEEERTVESEGDVELPQKRSTTPAGREPAATKSKRQQFPAPLAQEDPGDIRITFKVRERGVWRTAQSLLVGSSDPSKVERIAVKYMRKKEQIRLYDTDLNILTPPMCFQAAIANGSNMLLLLPGGEIDINEELEASVSQLLSEVNLQKEAGSK